MEPGPPETKRPRLSTGSSWSSNHGVSLPHPTAVAHHPQHSGPHHPAPSHYQHPHPPFSRPPESPLPAAHHHSHDDRRHHHDHEPYPPIQDPSRQLPPSPAHAPYPSYAPRDIAVKRDPGEETSLPQLRRPHSNSNGIIGVTQDNHPPGPPHHPNQQHTDDPRRPMSFDNGHGGHNGHNGHNGPSMPPHSPATMYRPPHQNYHPPTPVPQHPQYAESHVYGPPTPMYPPLEIQAASAKRKAQRASQACDSCRQLKAKCDETKPCKNCREKGMDCKYRDPPAKQPDKVTADILDLLSALKEEMTSMKGDWRDATSAIKKMDHRLTSVESSLRNLNSETANMKRESIEGDDRQGLRQSPQPDDKTAAEEQHSPLGTTADPRGPLSLNEAHEMIRNMHDEDIEDQPGPSVKPGKPAMPHNHTTLANLLLKWPAIHSMVAHHLAAERIIYIDEFPIRQEQLRGMLRVFGRGEGFDADIRVADKLTPQDHTMTEAGEDCSDAASPAPTGEAWGQVGSMTPPPAMEFKGGVINVEGNPDWDPNKVWKYVQSFKDNILNMHPIIIPRELDAIVTTFLNALPKSTENSNKSGSISKKADLARFINHAPTTVPSMPETGHKRKRSPFGDEESPNVSHKKPGRPFRSVDNALVLLVFALGKICLHKEKIPDVVRDPEAPSHGSPSVRNGILASPTQGSPPGLTSWSQSSSLPSPKEHDRAFMSRRSSLQGTNSLPRVTQSHKRNMDVVPGLEYFALATDIIGSHLGGFNLKHVWVHILAGLYHGQLGRVLESWSYITSASRTLQVILRPSFDRLTNHNYSLGQNKRDNQLAFAFWTCLQLESDILAEMQLPHSGILQYESLMPYPDTTWAVNQGFPAPLVQSYLAQLYLRKQLNQIHNLLYNPENDERQASLETGINHIQSMLKDTRSTWVPQDYVWNDSDPLATDILSARLRAKYWGSQVIIYRPFLRMILNNEAQPPTAYQIQPASAATWDNLGLDAGSPSVPTHFDPRTIDYARLAIEALVESTRAFHGMDPNQRIIVTNVFGTAHAQWGNLLTLAACYKDKLLGRFIDFDTLNTLFARTIKFFSMIAYPSSPLMMDMNILKGLANDLGFTQDDTGFRANTSFSSVTSGGPLPSIQNLSDNAYVQGSPTPSILRTHHLPPPPPHHPMSR
ncbi:hypothetical protein F5Y15DRAFT_10362 [Xylariaceae sp. FL0016]|nr:hypothetical protein F5Y15DRAFT_10362 [Xylariaceae sp. FL0016]